MSSTLERKRQRREYLKQKGAAYMNMSLTGCATVPLAYVALGLLVSGAIMFLGIGHGTVLGGIIFIVLGIVFGSHSLLC